MKKMFFEALPAELGGVLGGIAVVWLGITKEMATLEVLWIAFVIYGFFWGVCFLAILLGFINKQKGRNSSEG